jgi:hypothetical protein
LIFKWFVLLKIQIIKFQKTRFWKEKSVEDVVTLAPTAQATLVHMILWWPSNNITQQHMLENVHDINSLSHIISLPCPAQTQGTKTRGSSLQNGLYLSIRCDKVQSSNHQQEQLKVAIEKCSKMELIHSHCIVRSERNVIRWKQ